MTIVLFVGLGLAALRNNAEKNAEIARLSARIKQMEANASSTQTALTTIIRELRDRLDRPIDVPDGRVTAVDHEQRELHIDITRRQGAVLGMKMLIFNRDAPGVANEKPKGTIELTRVGDQFSTACIIKTNNPTEPIRVGDVVYSLGGPPNTPVRFALVGKVDLNRDGKDDRDEVKRMIQQAGGVIDFDLPPPDVGKESGRLLPRIDWYVVDDRTPSDKLDPAFKKRMGEVIKEARLEGIRPMPIRRLRDFLGNGTSPPVVGRSETVDRTGSQPAASPRQSGEPGANLAAPKR